MHYHLTVEVFNAGTMVNPESRHQFFAEVEPNAVLAKRVPADIQPEHLSMADREHIVTAGVEDVACDFLHSRDLLAFPLAAAVTTRRAIIKGSAPTDKAQVEKDGVKLWYLGSKLVT